jgi:acetone carboxylase gamma subunit
MKRKKEERKRKKMFSCDCYHCIGDYRKRFRLKTRVRKKFFKYPQKMILPE